MSTLIELYLIEIVLLIISFRFFLKRNNELLVIISLFTALMFYRYYALENELGEWIAFPYSVIVFEFSMSKAELVLGYILLGSAFFIFSFLLNYQSHQIWQWDNEDVFNYFLIKNKNIIIAGFSIFSVLNIFIQNFFSYAVTGSSYAFLLGMAQSSFIILTFLIYKQTSFNSPFQKLLFISVLAFSIIGSYNPFVRFQFLGWIFALSVILLRYKSAKNKLQYYLVGGVGAVILFSVAGLLRDPEKKQLGAESLVILGWENAKAAQDFNFIDGFVMVEQVYPDFLDYGYGAEQLDILLRPIPRQLWPGKPVGGWGNKLALKHNVAMPPTGISPTLYGSFYEDGGIVAIILLSCLYGYLLARICRYADRYNSTLQYIIKGIAIASVIPLLRGGDLPGVFAFIGMSYWPMFIFISRYNKFLKKERSSGLVISTTTLRSEITH